jgi:hypothetical protein
LPRHRKGWHNEAAVHTTCLYGMDTPHHGTDESTFESDLKCYRRRSISCQPVSAAVTDGAMSNPLVALGEVQKKLTARVDAFKKNRGVAVASLVDGLQAGSSGGMLGVGSYYLTKMNSEAMAKNPNVSPDMRKNMEAMSMSSKSLPQSVASFAVLLGVQKGLTTAFKHYRKEDDVWNACAPSHQSLCMPLHTF